jgi:tyrosine-protein kinase Etk/Wzc
MVAPESSPPTRRPGSLEGVLRLLRWRKLILLNTAIVAVLAVVISLLLPNWYKATASLLPPEEEALSIGGLSRGFSSALAAVRGGGVSIAGRLSLPMWATPSDLLAGILRSRRLQEAVIAEHDLSRVFKCKNMDQALGVFATRMKVRVSGEGIVRVSFLDRDPQRAAAVLATAFRALDEIQRDTRQASASGVRAFVARRLEQTTADLRESEERLRAFQEAHGLLVPEEQARALVDAIAKVEGERLATQVERDALASQVGPEHPELERLDALLRSLRDAQAELEGRDGAAPKAGARAGEGAGGTGGAPRSAIIDLGRLPELSLQFLRLLREVEIQQTLYALLVEMHEQYRIQEVRDTPTVQLLDPPTVPVEKDRPHRAVIVVLATALSFLASLLVAAGLERLAWMAEHEPERHAQLQVLLRGVGLGFLARR